MSDRDLVQELKATIVELSKDRDHALDSVKTKEARTKQVMIKLEHATQDVKSVGHKIDHQNKEIASLRAKLETKEKLLEEALSKLKNNEPNKTEKLDFKLPSRLDENSVLQILIDTYDALPNDIKIKVDASSNLAKDMSFATAIEGTNFGIAHNSDTQELGGYYTTKIGSDNNPIKITNKFTKNNIDNYTLKEIGFAQGENRLHHCERRRSEGVQNA